MRRSGVHVTVLAAAAALVVPLTPAGSATGAPSPRMPELQISNVLTGLSHPWDVQPLPGNRVLVGERDTGRLIVKGPSATRVLRWPGARIWSSGETGLMGLAVDPKFTKNRRIYTCQGGFTASGGHDVRVTVWRMSVDYTGVSYLETLIKGLPATSGRHGGCRLLIARNGALYVGTGDAAVGTNPQSRGSLGGKVLKLNRATGKPWPTNPWVTSKTRVKRYLVTYGHRNVQGLAQRSDGAIWSIEQGSSRDDEVNRLVAKGNYGWNPVPGYNEARPMTDFTLPGKQRAARWRSGSTTLATSGGAWVRGTQWGDLNGTLAVAALKAERVVFLKFSKKGKLLWTRTPAELRSSGRLRSITSAPNGDLLITTSNGGGDDRVLRVRPNR